MTCRPHRCEGTNLFPGPELKCAVGAGSLRKQRNVDRGGLTNPTVDLTGNPIDCAEQAANIAALRAKPLNLTIDCP